MDKATYEHFKHTAYQMTPVIDQALDDSGELARVDKCTVTWKWVEFILTWPILNTAGVLAHLMIDGNTEWVVSPDKIICITGDAAGNVASYSVCSLPFTAPAPRSAAAKKLKLTGLEIIRR